MSAGSPSPQQRSLQWWEPRLVVLFAVLLLVGNFLTAYLYPAFGDDDVLLSDAGVNLYLGHGFTSSAWPGQGKTEFFAGNLPLYPALLTVWLKLFGFSLTTLRLFSYLCGSLAVIALWCGLRRLHWLASPLARLACLLVLFLGHPLFKAIRRNRYDALHILLCSVLVVLWAMPWRMLPKGVALCFATALLTVAGFQAAAYVGLLCLLALLWEGRSAWAKLWWMGLGVALGVGGVLLLFWGNDALHGLQSNIEWGKRLDGGTPAILAHTRFHRTVVDSVKDPAVVPLFLGLLIPFTQRLPQPLRRRSVRLALVAVALYVAIIAALEATIHFASYYRWMTAIPVTILVFAMLEGCFTILTTWRKVAVVSAVGVALALGYPALLTDYLLVTRFGPQLHEMEHLAGQFLKPTDVVFAEYFAYPAAKPRAQEVYFPGYLERMTAAEERKVNFLIIREEAPANWYTKLNGEYLERFSRQGQRWVKLGQVSTERGLLMQWLARTQPEKVAAEETRMSLYRVSFFRRADVAAPWPPAD